MADERYRARRQHIADLLKEGEMFIIFSGDSEQIRILPPDRSRVSTNFYYLTGVQEPDMALLMIRSGSYVSETLFIPAQSDMEVFYMGMAKDAAYYREMTGIRDVDYSYNLDSRISMQAFMASVSMLYIACGNKTVLSHPTQESVFVQRMRDSFPHMQIGDLNEEIICMRRIKDTQEVADIQKAIDLTGLAIDAVWKQAGAGMNEAQVEAICDYTIRMNGGEGALETVVAAGNNANILHYFDRDGVLKDGEMALVDLCAGYNHYVSDITRVFPVNGKFTERQAYWYNVCLNAQNMIVVNMKPGAGMRECGKEAIAYVADELVKNGIIKTPEEMGSMIGQKRKDYVTVVGVNHSIGLVCDETGLDYKFRTLQPGMVYTVEPGIYLGSEGFGIRIEDDYLVTEDGVICLSAGIPKTVEEIEKAMARS